MNWVTIPDRVIAAGVRAGKNQALECQANGRANYYGAGDRDDPAEKNELGLIGEHVVGWIYGVPWEYRPFSRRHEPDIGGVGVRTTTHLTGHLLLHDEDEDARPYVLVVRDRHRFGIAGWCFGMDGKLSRYWAPWMKSPCFAVPQFDLAPADTLPIGDRIPGWCR
jgi:hypothetical protein